MNIRIHIYNIKTPFFRFISPKKDRIKQNTLIGPIEKGGLNMIDIHAFVKAIKASWFVKINNNSEWNFISKHMIRFCTIKNMFIHINFKCWTLPCLVTLDLTDFYKQVLNAFFASRSKTAEKTSFQNEILWGNNKFKVKNKHGYEVLYFTRWINADIIFVKDLKQLNNNICEQFIFGKVRYKNNIISEAMQRKHVLKPL